MPDDDCKTCNGSGTIWVKVTSPDPEPAQEKTCPVCHGTGKK